MKDTVNEVKKNLSELDYLLGENNVEDIKKRIGDLIVDVHMTIICFIQKIIPKQSIVHLRK